MKTYKLKYPSLNQENVIVEIITHPENQDLGMTVHFDGYTHGKLVDTIPPHQIWQYVQTQLLTKMIGKDLALEIAKDYPLLFNQIPLEFPAQKLIPTTDAPLFSHLDDNAQLYAETKLKELNNKLINSPNCVKFKLDKAELLLNSGEYLRALSDYNELLSIATNDSYASKIRHGLEICDQVIQQSTTCFQTPFDVEESNDEAMLGDTCTIRESTLYNTGLFSTSSIDKKNMIETYSLEGQEHISLSFDNATRVGNKDDGYSLFSLMINDKKELSMYLDGKTKQILTDNCANYQKIIEILRECGATANEIADKIQANVRKDRSMMNL